MEFKIRFVRMIYCHKAIGTSQFAQLQSKRSEIQLLTPGIYDHKVIARAVHIPYLHNGSLSQKVIHIVKANPLALHKPGSIHRAFCQHSTVACLVAKR